MCAVPECVNVVDRRGWCTGHYIRWWRTGDVRPDVPLGTSRRLSQKLCQGCDTVLPRAAFGESRDGKIRMQCRPCWADHNRRWRQNNPEKTAATKRRAHLKAMYGLTPEAFEAMLQQQGEACAACGGSEGRFVVDHDHDTGEVRGILCDGCNLALGLLRDSPDRIVALLAYISDHDMSTSEIVKRIREASYV